MYILSVYNVYILTSHSLCIILIFDLFLPCVVVGSSCSIACSAWTIQLAALHACIDHRLLYSVTQLLFQKPCIYCIYLIPYPCSSPYWTYSLTSSYTHSNIQGEGWWCSVSGYSVYIIVVYIAYIIVSSHISSISREMYILYILVLDMVAIETRPRERTDVLTLCGGSGSPLEALVLISNHQLPLPTWHSRHPSGRDLLSLVLHSRFCLFQDSTKRVRPFVVLFQLSTLSHTSRSVDGIVPTWYKL